MTKSRRRRSAAVPSLESWQYSHGHDDEQDDTEVTDYCDTCTMHPEEVIEPWGIRCRCWMYGIPPLHECSCGPCAA